MTDSLPEDTPEGEMAARERAAYKRGWEDREADFLAGVERTGLAVVAPDALADAYRAGAEAMREACAKTVDCACLARASVLEALQRGGERSPDWLCHLGDDCRAIVAAELRRLPLPARPVASRD
jgi:hypothetical protein